MEIFKHFDFDAAHFLPLVPEDHKCRRVHGHTYRLKICFEGEMDYKLGWVVDFAEIKKHVNPIINCLDHQMLNDIEGLENPTCEVIAMWLWDRIKPNLPLLSSIELYETLTSGVIYKGE